MKYLKYFENHLKEISKSDDIVDKLKSKLNLELEKEFSKYLEPGFIKIGKENDVKVFLLKPDFGVRIKIDFHKEPFHLYANICAVFLENGKWKRSAYTKFYPAIKSQSKKHLEEFVKKYFNELEKKYINRMKRLLNKDINKYNL